VTLARMTSLPSREITQWFEGSSGKLLTIEEESQTKL